MKILIIEDEELLAKVLQEKFHKAGYQTSLVYSGDRALPEVKSFRPDIIILDLILPKKSGLEILKELKADPEIKSIPVIVLSNIEEDESIKKALSLGAVDYYVKTQHPILEVIEKVETHLIKPKGKFSLK